jgi:ribosomal-protein-alanine N-acetyltransferase
MSSAGRAQEKMRAEEAGAAAIVRAGPEHAAAIAALHARLFDAAYAQGWNSCAFARHLAEPVALSFVAVAGAAGAAVGFAVGRIVADEAEILSLGVAGDRQRQGIGSRLLRAVAGAAAQAGAGVLHLEVGAGNGAALRLYQSHGFAEAGRRRAYYARPGAHPEDAVLLRLALPLSRGALPRRVTGPARAGAPNGAEHTLPGAAISATGGQQGQRRKQGED